MRLSKNLLINEYLKPILCDVLITKKVLTV